MKSTIRTRALAPLAGIALLFAASACGSDDEAPPPSAPESDLELTMTDPPADDAADEEAAAGGDYCETLQSFGDDVLAGAGSTDPDAAAGLVESYREIAAVAPDDVAADWTAMADAMQTLADIDPADPEAAGQLEDLGDLAAISQRLGESVQSECG
ncbi:hypothetical protein [Jiangella rhizosphaerae]|uniref:Uncharacterized protein n=1 Tax=Jiangella rhizosphaerae TaxID=2293569 RepID=A0A418KQP4_9ACTN|nr:hypothetical protein [Jiangella rhizosphaerae]RIQ22880.1 hypothetical protein DY240_13215 [Jiangella rhizosphaerae]